jgi:hypothetical protein
MGDGKGSAGEEACFLEVATHPTGMKIEVHLGKFDRLWDKGRPILTAEAVAKHGF